MSADRDTFCRYNKTFDRQQALALAREHDSESVYLRCRNLIS
jgi:hypothetical protein